MITLVFRHTHTVGRLGDHVRLFSGDAGFDSWPGYGVRCFGFVCSVCKHCGVRVNKAEPLRCAYNS
jgi:hypothetical protein